MMGYPILPTWIFTEEEPTIFRRAGIAPAGIPNPDLKWETTTQFNIGADIEFFEERVSLSVDYYHNVTKDLLFNRPISMTSGFSFHHNQHRRT
jgi:outer membrane receptor protein involved in Fe transport